MDQAPHVRANGRKPVQDARFLSIQRFPTVDAVEEASFAASGSGSNIGTESITSSSAVGAATSSSIASSRSSRSAIVMLQSAP